MLLKARRLDTTPPEDVIKGMLPETGVAFLYGPSWHGKSLVVLAMEMAIANGLPFMGREVKQGRAVMSMGEGLYDAGVRKQALIMASGEAGITLSDAGLFFEDQGFDLGDKTQAQLAIQRWKPIAGLQIAAIDPVTMFTGGRPIESPAVAARLMSNAIMISQQLRVLILLVHHTTKNSDDMRGAKVLFDLADCVIFVKDNVISHRKMKAGPLPDPAEFEIEPVGWIDDETGEMVRTAIVRQVTDDLDDDDLADLGNARKDIGTIAAQAVIRHGLEEQFAADAREQGVPLHPLIRKSLAVKRGEADAADAEEPAADASAEADGKPRLIRGTGLDPRAQKRTGIKPVSKGPLAVG